jgi:hypothetical protein
MIHAAKNGHVSTVELLIDSNADPNIQDKVCILKDTSHHCHTFVEN